MQEISSKLPLLGDLELAALLCLIANEHGLIWTESEAIDVLAKELELVARRIFGLSSVVLNCSRDTTLDEFAEGILVVDHGGDDGEDPSLRRSLEGSYFASRLERSRFQSLSESSYGGRHDEDRLSVPNVVIAKNLNLADPLVQIQALELLRTRRIYTRTTLQSAPKKFLFIPLLAAQNGPLLNHLNDHIFISHYHPSETGFPNLDESTTPTSISDASSQGSVVKTKTRRSPSESALFNAQDIDHLSTLSIKVAQTMEVKRYQQNIVVFLRMHRAVAGGMSSRATKYLDLLVKCLAPLHAQDYATPSLVVLAVRKIYPHRIQIVAPENERSMQWGSDIEAVAAMLKETSPQKIIEEVLETVEAPL